MWLCIAQHLTKPQLTLIRETTLQKVLMHCTLENQIIMHFKHSWSHCQLALSCLQVQWQVTGWCSGQGFSYSFLPELTAWDTKCPHQSTPTRCMLSGIDKVWRNRHNGGCQSLTCLVVPTSPYRSFTMMLRPSKSLPFFFFFFTGFLRTWDKTSMHKLQYEQRKKKLC